RDVHRDRVGRRAGGRRGRHRGGDRRRAGVHREARGRKQPAPEDAPVNPLFTLRIAAIAILRNKIRSFLTALGIIIGVGAVITMMAIGEGAKKMIEDQFAAMGTNLLIILPGSSTSGGARGGSGTAPSLTWEDLKMIQTLSSVAAAAPSLRSSAT